MGRGLPQGVKGIGVKSRGWWQVAVPTPVMVRESWHTGCAR